MMIPLFMTTVILKNNKITIFTRSIIAGIARKELNYIIKILIIFSDDLEIL